MAEPYLPICKAFLPANQRPNRTLRRHHADRVVARIRQNNVAIGSHHHAGWIFEACVLPSPVYKPCLPFSRCLASHCADNNGSDRVLLADKASAVGQHRDPIGHTEPGQCNSADGGVEGGKARFFGG